MGTMTTTYSRISRQAEYQNGDLRINLNYQVNESDKKIVSIDGELSKGENHVYAGRFNGRPDGDDIKYDTSGVKLQDMPKLYESLTEIEGQIAEEFTPVDED